MKYPKKCHLLGLFFISNIFAVEKLYVSEIDFIGNSYLSEYELTSAIKLQSPKLFVRSEFSPKKLNRDKISIGSYYKSKGFLNIKVTQKYELISKNYINIQFYINEGFQYKLKEIQFSGNKLFDDNEIMEILNVSINDKGPCSST